MPLRLPDAAYARGAAAAWAYPLAGLVLGLISGLAGWAVAGIGAGLAGIVAIAVTVILSGAMHEDGLADVADGFWGGWDRDRRLRDHEGQQHQQRYGTMALILGFAARWWASRCLPPGMA
ncbi:MAG: adenosylcobinamide-GDP ribazoletransferase [Thalassovita sp.]